MSDCLFCKIVNGDIPAAKVFEDADVIGFNDISPQAPHHVLFIPKRHISTIPDSDSIMLSNPNPTRATLLAIPPKTIEATASMIL